MLSSRPAPQTAMEHWTRMEYPALVLAVAMESVARAADEDWEHRINITHTLQPHHQWQPGTLLRATPWWFIGIIAVMAFFFVIAAVAGCAHRSKRRRMKMANQTLTPPSLAAVMSGAEMYGSLGQQPSLSVATAPPPEYHLPQQRCYPPQAMCHTQVPSYGAQYVDHFQYPSAPLHQPPLDPPPPYSSLPFFVK